MVIVDHSTPYVSIQVVYESDNAEDTTNATTKHLESLQEFARTVLKNAKTELMALLTNQIKKTSTTVLKKISSSYDSVQDTGNLIFNETAVLVEESNDDGINADECMTKADEQIVSTKRAGMKNIETCQSAALEMLDAYADKVVDSLNAGENLVTKLNEVLVLCESPDEKTTNTCVIGKTQNVPVNDYKISVETLKDDILPTTNTAVNKVWQCAFKHVVETRENLLKVKEDAKTCITLCEEKQLMA
ncbi:hypothetical protein KM043_017514 [Ampulex compressa]|nr:hypothetical protein KM043_017514 [Ampulex compressa]